MLCFYHRGDLDGHCAGAIVQKFRPEARMVGLDYEDDFAAAIPWAEITKGVEVFMVDFCLPNIADMKRLQELSGHYFIWCDHHHTAIAKAREAGFSAPGIQRVGAAGCELVCEHLFPLTAMPRTVSLLGRYDVWDEKHTDWQSAILPFQYGLKINPTDPAHNQQLWKALFKNSGSAVEELIKTGATILAYQHQENAKLMARHGFLSQFDGLRALVVNNGPGGSMKFEGTSHEHFPIEHFPLMISFARLPEKKWLVNLYTFREDVDCGEIDRRHGGGGHRKAAGFICTELPFAI